MLGGNKGEAMARQREEWGECILPFLHLTARAQEGRLYHGSEDITAAPGSAGFVKVPVPVGGTAICTSDWQVGVRLWKIGEAAGQQAISGNSISSRQFDVAHKVVTGRALPDSRRSTQCLVHRIVGWSMYAVGRQNHKYRRGCHREPVVCD